ncbi:hypothetical protein IQ266_23365 [filamentous cyanobacterium LEGE 11480]|uniref:Uncharacterized protein n=1 Tax=Romeriopsis navalis LEGE 11480 TaxID=2777977 RepID=A0A928VU86_9CYAN|nr:hypothetical protein [Romeriopsis navalis]MBE9032680.1 hypothetical protein [Romeriopsis navalis LEGE 11480]
MNQLLGAGLIFVICPLLGALLLPPERSRRKSVNPSRPMPWSSIDWSQWSWGLEILQGLLAVGLAKLCFPYDTAWEMIALMGVAAGRFWRHRSGGILMMLSGYLLHNPISGMLVLVFGLIGSIILRENRQITFVWLMLMPLMTVLRDSRSGVLVLLTAGLAGILYGMEQRQSPETAKATSQLFRADSLNDDLNPAAAGELATTLSLLKRQGFPVPMGWVIYPGDDPESLSKMIKPRDDRFWLVRSSFVDDSASDVASELVGLQSIWAAIVALFESHSGERVAAIVQPQPDYLYAGWVYCQAPTMKADVPTPVAEKVLALVDRLNEELNTLETLEWGYDGKQVWILQVK